MSASTTPWFATPLAGFDDGEDVTTSSVSPMAMRHAFDSDALHELFHENTKYHRRTHAGFSRQIRAFLQDPTLIARGAASYRDLASFAAIDLPEPAPLAASLKSCLERRRSAARRDLCLPFTADNLSSVLHYAVRVNRTAAPTNAPHVSQTFRPYPSGGGLFPIEVYVISNAVAGLPATISYYEARNHRLRPLPNSAASEFRAAETTGDDAEPAACAIVVTAVFDRSVQKYGPRGYRLALIEAGHMMQNLLLVATGLGLKSLVSGSFYEAEVERALHLDGVSEAVLATVFLGAQ
jgi:SagB-type dehydrogenase family enzyme